MVAEQPIFFVLPAGSEDVSGGNLYNRGLLEALRGQCDVRSMSVARWLERSAEPGIYLVDTLNLTELAKVAIRKTPDQRFVLLVHHLPSIEPGLAPDHPLLMTESQALPAVDAFLATGQFTRELIASYGYGDRVFTVEPPPPAARAAARSFEGPVHALMACNLIPRKGVLAFLGSLADLVQDGDAFRIDVVGRVDLDASYGARCSELLASSEALVDRVSLHGPSAHHDMLRWYQAANLFASASRMETFGISLQEARHHGLPVLAVEGGNSGSHVEVGATGELFASPEELARGFLALVREPARLRDYFDGAQARRPTDSETWDSAAARVLAAIERWPR